MKSCCPAGASVLIRSSLPATQAAGVFAVSTERTGSVAPAPLKSCVPPVNVLESASLASAVLTLLTVVCRLLTSTCLAAVSESMLLCNVVSADWRAAISTLNAALVAISAGVSVPTFVALTLVRADPSPEKAWAVAVPCRLRLPLVLKIAVAPVLGPANNSLVPGHGQYGSRITARASSWTKRRLSCHCRLQTVQGPRSCKS